jgi:hypothetical protein
MSSNARLAKYAGVSVALTRLSDQDLSNLLNLAPLVATGVGGRAVLLEIEGVPVFAKFVRLTDLEQRPENHMSTANVFQLPPFCQYGVGSPGLGAWREVAANTLMAKWALEGQCESFPLMYHWRVIKDSQLNTPPSPSLNEEFADVERMVEYWDHSPAMRARLEAIRHSSASVVIFLEHIQHNLKDWLAMQKAVGAGAIESACAMVERNLVTDALFFSKNGFMHFDAHFRNILTDGERLYFADLGLSTSRRFALSEDEIEFLDRNTKHDECYLITQLVNWLVTNLSDVAHSEKNFSGRSTPYVRNEFIRGCADGAEPSGAPAWAAAVIKRYAPVAAVMNAFYLKLQVDCRATPFPIQEIERACDVSIFLRELVKP